MQWTLLKIYLPQTTKHHGRLLHEWLLESAREIGIPGGSAFRAVAGYGRHGRLHEEHFFELAGDLPMTVEFVAEAAKIDALLQQLAAEKITLFYLRLPVEGGQT
jgi:PII-like signaling protein